MAKSRINRYKRSISIGRKPKTARIDAARPTLLLTKEDDGYSCRIISPPKKR